MESKNQLIKNIIQSRNSNFKLEFSMAQDRIVSLSINKIVRIEAQGEVSRIFLTNNGKNEILVAESLSKCESRLTEFGFYRIHRQHLLNLSYLSNPYTTFNNEVLLSNNETLPMARRRKKDFETFLMELGLI